MAKRSKREKRSAKASGAGEAGDESLTGRTKPRKVASKGRSKNPSNKRRTARNQSTERAHRSKVMNELQQEIDANFDFIQSQMAELVKDNRNRFALLRHKEIVGIYDTIRDAKITGDHFFDDGIFSIQKIEDNAVELGFYSHALHLGDTQ